MAHLHPLLREAAEESSSESKVPGEDQPKLFDRIDASKLQGALSNASMMGRLEQEGVPSHLLPAVVQAQKEAAAEAAAKDKEKPPPGPKAKALFDFNAQSDKELSFKKGDFLDLLHSIDDNWLEAKLAGNKGNIPRSYVKVLTLQQFRELSSPGPPKDTQLAKVLFDFQGQADKELSFKKGDDLYIEKKIDANWYEGYYGDTKGIFPVAYVQLT